MFGRKSKSKPLTPSIPPHPDDNWRLKSTGQRVAILRRLDCGDVSVEVTDSPYPRDAIVAADDLRRA
ncbi:hypothetical protein [Streptomyces sp. CS081A]|uniref:hypothetical protein n=1 Tax=Streptomyces sp. CS081A TaxID=2162709 RepID=UPI000D50D7F4|nr:hypothetical protein [Streptomyces sp. CS081A]PVC73491.1 hypothetical protein DBP18_14185 [Streptomyces sp. CS081A]